MSNVSCPNREHLLAYVRGTLDELLAGSLEEHLDHCADCERRLDELEAEQHVLPSTIAEIGESEWSDADAEPGLLRAMQRLLQHDVSRPEHESLDRAEPTALGHYRIKDQLGRGGMGTVYLAHDTRLDREVALKVPRQILAGDSEARERFLREARAAAGLRHPNICPIYEVGEAGGQPYIAMAYIQGKTLGEWVDEGRSVREIAEMMSRLSEAVAFAHATGIVHRDLKPSNVVIEAGTDAPILMDFGLAVDVGKDAARTTQDGYVIGTPAYMAPEQAAGRIQDVGPGSDVYALGAMLYELLCGQVPFPGNMADVLSKVQHEDPPSVRAIAPRVHRDLETIVLKCMAKEVASRYATAEELAEDLRRFGQGEPIVARRIGRLHRFVRQARRRPSMVLAAAAVVVALTVVAYYAPRMNRARNANRLVNEIHDLMDRDRWLPGDVDEVESRIRELESLSAIEAQASRGRLANRTARAIRENLQRPRLEPESIRTTDELLARLHAAWPEEASLLSAQRDRRVREWQVDFELAPPFEQFDREFASRLLHTENGESIALRPETAVHGESVAVLSRRSSKGNVRMDVEFGGDWRGGQLGLLMHCDGGHPGPVTAIASSPQGHSLTVGNAAGMLSIWDMETRHETFSLRAHSTSIRNIVYSPTGTTAATTASDGSTSIWAYDGWSELAKFPPSPTTAPPLGSQSRRSPLAFSHDGRFLAIGQTRPESPCDVMIWDVAGRRETARLSGHRDSITNIAFHPTDSTQLASSSVDGTVRLWNHPEGTQTRLFEVGAEDVHDRIWDALVSVAFINGGKSIVAGKTRESLVQWNLATGEREQTWNTAAVSPGRDGLNDLLVSPDRTLIALRHRPQLDIWQLPEMRYLWTVSEGPFCFLPSSDRIAVGTQTGTVMIWDIARRRMATTLGGTHLAFRVRSLSPRLAETFTDSADANDALGGPVEVSILRSGVLLRREECTLAEGALRLSVQRENERLSLQLNDREPVVFRDVLPANRPTAGAYGIILSPSIRIKRLAAFRQPLPPASSPLELGDELYGLGRYSEAYTEYRRQMVSTLGDDSALEVQREAECKSALCLSALGRHEQASSVFKSMLNSTESSDRWSAVASFQLVLANARQTQLDDASELSEAALLSYGNELLAEHISMETRRQIVDAHAAVFDPHYSALRMGGLRHVKALYEARQLLPMSVRQERALALQLAGGLPGTHLEAEATTVATSLRAALPSQLAKDRVSGPPDLATLQAHGCLADHPGSHLNVIDEFLFGTETEQLEWRLDLEPEQRETTKHSPVVRTLRPKLMPEGCFLFVERARILTRQRQWEEAASSLREFDRFASTISVPYEPHALRFLLGGMLHEQTGDGRSASEAWRRARWSVWRQQSGQLNLRPRPESASHTLLNSIAESFCEEATPDSRLAANTLFQAAGVPGLSTIIDRDGELPEQTVSRLWIATKAGKENARRIVVGEMLPAEQVRCFARLVLVTAVDRGCPAASESEAHQRIVEEAVDSILGHARMGRLGRGELQNLLFAWRGDLGVLGWSGRGPGMLAANQRSQLAYLLGTRLLRVFHRNEDARKLFRVARDSSPADAPVRRLAQVELQRLGSLEQ